ncbi:glutamine--fructose-6-phosphate transaminase (isomerizing) [Patescibacteria group bacterium]|nr:glutamine--fructose-6-phosphate transaminase (isomerizing) [Patescibacteria group bacterium]MBU2158949.1 glutamine--fructose-6-phosphate transaminase (isomerizing) [Patescibacteria group bacterium]
MCGIVGYVGKKNAAPFLLEGLSALEYRGYDSAGMYVSGAGALKRAGKVAELIACVPDDFEGKSGIAHTRWATHGAPTELNAHPHTDASKTVWLVHNGIIENHSEIRKDLEAKGVVFASQTDSEALAQLIGHLYTEDMLLEDAVRAALAQVQGTYGVAVASTREPEKVVVARMGSPLMLGVGEDGIYVASDATPILPYTRKAVYLDDGEMAIITDQGYVITDADEAHVDKPVTSLEWSAEAAQKKGYEHFMLKEIMEVGEVIENTLRGRLDTANATAILGGFQDTDIHGYLKHAKRIIITGCGSAYYAGLIGKTMIEELAGIPVEVEIASELRYRRPTADPKDTVLIAVSQSGETADTLEAIRAAKRQGILTLGIVNVVGSTVARETDAGVYNHAGPEIGVASTKAFISQVLVFALVALHLARERGLSKQEGSDFIKELETLPEKARAILTRTKAIEAVAKKYAHTRDFLYLGRKFQCPIAFEGALKLKEISYIHAEGYGAGEMKHGPLALIDTDFPSLVLAPRDSMYEKTASNIEEIRARSGKVIALTTDGNDDITRLADDVLYVPETHEALLPVLTTIPLQLFAYYIAKERDCPIDKPRNLAKSVTVE